ncbi:MAG: GNAT family N-acetyltransferase [Solirubrobacteraceae bacterium]
MAATGERITLADGGTVVVRDLHAEDRDGYIEAVGAMSDRSRYQRFASPTPKLSDRAIDYLTHIDGVHHVALVALDGDHGAGVARYVRFAPGRAEIAIGLVDAWQRRGLGSILLDRLIARARAAGDLDMLEAMTLADNRGAQHLLRSCGFRPDHREGIMLVLRLEL